MLISVEAPRKELVNGYLYWIHAHQKGDFDVKLPASHIDLYDSSGRSIHYEDRPERASAFLHLLMDRSTSPADTSPSMRPSLADAMGMFSELKPYDGHGKAKSRYTAFVLTDRDRAEECRQQNEAVAEFKKRAVTLNIRVIEVRVHREAQ